MGATGAEAVETQRLLQRIQGHLELRKSKVPIDPTLLTPYFRQLHLIPRGPLSVSITTSWNPATSSKILSGFHLTGELIRQTQREELRCNDAIFKPESGSPAITEIMLEPGARISLDGRLSVRKRTELTAVLARCVLASLESPNLPLANF